MAWVLLIAAGLFETAFAVCLKMSNGLTVLWPTVAFAASALCSFGLLTLALRDLEVGPAYAAWTGIGAVGSAAFGMLILGETASAVKLVSIALIVAGVVGLSLSGVTR
jgi:quaternary ammonium compound-resistance protein SugE